MTLSIAKDTMTWDEVAKLLGVTTPDDKQEEVYNKVVNGDYGWCWKEAREALGEDATSEQVDEKAQEMESDAVDRECVDYMKDYYAALERVFVMLCGEHGLDATLVEKKRHHPKARETYFKLAPKVPRDWTSVACMLIDTINGYGRFHFNSVRELVSSGPYISRKQAALSHIHWISSHPEVYEGTKCARLVDNQMRRR